MILPKPILSWPFQGTKRRMIRYKLSGPSTNLQNISFLFKGTSNQFALRRQK
jgi:hypothetical protein